ncbi:hypothetical protein [Shewanella waksmanii]|uniref:hypothetical protein n=1 Tax=Shewanella waksmanii TaxID=213783 RepID=UPI00048C5D74|nr:hypothetical protein [Shewanella waksmanii]
MKNINRLKLTLVSFGLFLGAQASIAFAASCADSCVITAQQQQIAMCSGQQSACAASEPLFNHLYQQCLQTYCSN